MFYKIKPYSEKNRYDACKTHKRKPKNDRFVCTSARKTCFYICICADRLQRCGVALTLKLFWGDLRNIPIHSP